MTLSLKLEFRFLQIYHIRKRLPSFQTQEKHPSIIQPSRYMRKEEIIVPEMESIDINFSYCFTESEQFLLMVYFMSIYSTTFIYMKIKKSL